MSQLRRGALAFVFLLLLSLITGKAWGLDCGVHAKSGTIDQSLDVKHLERDTFRDLAHDQACIWTSPVQLSKSKNLLTFIPWAGATATLIATDRDVMRDYHPTSSEIKRASRFSNAGFYGLIGTGAAFYVVGSFTDNDRAKETGWLAGEAVVDALAINAVTQTITRRARPDATTDPGKWFVGGRAFPSDHAMGSWAIATVIAHEYPGWLSKLTAYGVATGVSAARVLAEKHSPSDVFVGSSIGFVVGNYVYHSRHKSEFSDGQGLLSSLKLRSASSPYLPLDSPYYPMLEHMAAAGYIDSMFLGMRPWKRTECARMVAEAEQRVPLDAHAYDIEVLHELQAEFGNDPTQMPRANTPVESVYTRLMGISGEPLRDSYHFGQTLYNDFGRPYWEGFNAIAGASGATSMGPLTFYMRGEFQYAPGGPTYSNAATSYVQFVDQAPGPLLQPNVTQKQFSLVEAYVSIPWKNLDFSGGKEALWWGPGDTGAMMYSNNAESAYMFRISQISPYRLGGIFKFFGPVKFDAYMGKLAGHMFPRAPYMHGQKFTFKPTENLEIGFSRTVIFAGVGSPLTFDSFAHSLFSVGDKLGQTTDAGDRRSGVDFTYRIPKLRRWLSIYGDLFTDDDPSPLSAPHRSAFSPGLYLTQVPGVKKLDLRIEAPTTATSGINERNGDFFYWNGHYLDGFTNKGQIIGDWIGRQAKGIAATSNYSFAPRKVLEFGYRHSTLDPEFILNGGNYTDGSVGYRTLLKDLSVGVKLQVERWNIPLVSPTVQRNATFSIAIGWDSRPR